MEQSSNDVTTFLFSSRRKFPRLKSCRDIVQEISYVSFRTIWEQVNYIKPMRIPNGHSHELFMPTTLFGFVSTSFLERITPWKMNMKGRTMTRLQWPNDANYSSFPFQVFGIARGKLNSLLPELSTQQVWDQRKVQTMEATPLFKVTDHGCVIDLWWVRERPWVVGRTIAKDG
jgi:hypothetical protein